MRRHLPCRAVALALRGSPRPGHRIVVSLTGAAAGQAYRWEICSKSRCRVVPGVHGPSLRLQRAWKGLRVRVSVVLETGGVPERLTGETLPIA